MGVAEVEGEGEVSKAARKESALKVEPRAAEEGSAGGSGGA